jgi:hypothetical protein
MKDIEETFKAECIDDTIGITKGKKYIVAQSKEYDKYFALRNDNGEIDTYRKERFKLVEDENICYQKECSGNKENKCTVEDRICVSRIKEPINYEEEYKKIKKDIELRDKYFYGLEEKYKLLNAENNSLSSVIKEYKKIIENKDKIIEQIHNDNKNLIESIKKIVQVL